MNTLALILYLLDTTFQVVSNKYSINANVFIFNKLPLCLNKLSLLMLCLVYVIFL